MKELMEERLDLAESTRRDIDRSQQIALVVGAVGLLICAVGAFVDTEQFFRSYLFGFVLWIGLAIGAFGLYMLHHLVGGAWGFLIRRLLSAAMRTFPLLLVLFIPLVFGLETLYPWARPDAAANHILHLKAAYLNVPFFLGRAALYFAIWIGWGFRVFRLVKRQEDTGELALIRKMQNISAVGILLLVLTVTFASIDWLMSLEPEWFSTMFGVIQIIGFALSALSLATIMLVKLSESEPMSQFVRPQIFHDLGNLLFGFTLFWAYCSFSQFLIIWSGNIAEETPWYIHRTQGGWEFVAYFLLLFAFAVPFLLLLSRRNKRDLGFLKKMAIWILVVRLVELFWFTAPTFYPDGIHLHWLDIAAPVGIGGIWYWFYIYQLKQRPLLFLTDPRMREAIHRIDEKEPHHTAMPGVGQYEQKGA
jgi:hypothetical protein